MPIPTERAAQKLLENERKRAKSAEDAEIEALLNRKSSHAEEAEDEWMERFQKNEEIRRPGVLCEEE